MMDDNDIMKKWGYKETRTEFVYANRVLREVISEARADEQIRSFKKGYDDGYRKGKENERKSFEKDLSKLFPNTPAHQRLHDTVVRTVEQQTAKQIFDELDKLEWSNGGNVAEADYIKLKKKYLKGE